LVDAVAAEVSGQQGRGGVGFALVDAFVVEPHVDRVGQGDDVDQAADGVLQPGEGVAAGGAGPGFLAGGSVDADDDNVQFLGLVMMKTPLPCVLVRPGLCLSR